MSSPFSTVCQAFGRRAEKHEHEEAFSRQSSIPRTSANPMGFCKMLALHKQLEGAECFKTITRAKVVVYFTGLTSACFHFLLKTDGFRLLQITESLYYFHAATL